MGTSGSSLIDYSNINRELHTFVYHPTTETIVPLNSHLTTANLPNPDNLPIPVAEWWIHNVTGINDSGQISGHVYIDNDGDGNLIEDPDNTISYGVVISPSPTEPGKYDVMKWDDRSGANLINNSGDTQDGDSGQMMLYQVGKPPVNFGHSDDYGLSVTGLSNRYNGEDVIVVGPGISGNQTPGWKFNTATDIAAVFIPAHFSLTEKVRGRWRTYDVSKIYDVSDAGILVGQTSVNRSDVFAAVYVFGEWSILGTLGTHDGWDDSFASSVSDNSDWVVGLSHVGVNYEIPNQLGFLYDMQQDYMFNLNSLIDPLISPPFLDRVERLKVNNNGWICGNYLGRAVLLVP